jgi:hypothetical protein
MALAPDPFLLAAEIFDPPAPVEDEAYDPLQVAANPVAFAHDVLGFAAWSKQQEVMRAVRDHDRVAVRSCHGVGKTAVAAHLALWFLAAHPGNSRVITTAPTWAQIADQLWREIRAAVAAAHDRGELLTWPAPNVTKLELGTQWFAVGHSTDRPERFQGHHADHLLLIVDEASGVDERIFEAAEGFLTAAGAKVLLIGNPTQTGGQFHRAFTTERAQWAHVHVSALDCPNETGEAVPDHVARALPKKGWAQERAAAWGVDSAIYQVRVLGQFPTSGDDVVLALGAVEAAQQRWKEGEPRDSQHERVVIACDVARFGDDETVIAERVGQRITILETYRGKATTFTAGRVEHWASRHPEPHVRIVIDDTGVGGGVTDQMRARGRQVTAFNAGERANRPLKFPNRRSELWFEMAAQLPDLEIDPDDQLTADLTAPRHDYDLAQRRVVEAKDRTKKRIGRSPDRADAVLLTLVGHDPAPEHPRKPVASITGDLLNDNSF